MSSKKRYSVPKEFQKPKVNSNGCPLMLGFKKSDENQAKIVTDFARAIINSVVNSFKLGEACQDLSDRTLSATNKIVPVMNIGSNKAIVTFLPWKGKHSNDRVTVVVDIKTSKRNNVFWSWDGNYVIESRTCGNVNIPTEDAPSKNVYEFEFNEFKDILKKACCEEAVKNNSHVLSDDEVNSLFKILNDDNKNKLDKANPDHSISRQSKNKGRDLKDYDFKKKTRNVRKPKAYDHLTNQVFDVSSSGSGNCKKIAIKNIIKAICSNYFSKPHYYIDFNKIIWTNDSNTNTDEYSVIVRYHRKTFKINVSLEESYDEGQATYSFWGRYVISKYNPNSNKWNVIKYDTLPLKNVPTESDASDVGDDLPKKIKKHADMSRNDISEEDLDKLDEQIMKFKKTADKIFELADRIESLLNG